MQLKKIAYLTALACAGFAGQAQAALSGDLATRVTDANDNGRVIYISGASAVQRGFTGIIGKLFNTDTTAGGVALTYFAEKNSNITGTDYIGVVGVLSSDAGTWAGENAIVINRVRGGSVWGVNPVARGTEIESLFVTAADCGSPGTGTSSAPIVCPLTDGSIAKPHRIPDAGVSDVAPALFKGPTNTEGEIPALSLSDDELANLTEVTPIYGLAFGVAANNRVSSDIIFNKSALSALYAGNVKGWDKIKAGETGDVVICRRVPGSGTQAVFNLHFGNFPCTADANAPANRTSGAPAYKTGPNRYDITASLTSTGAASKLWVIENSTSGDVRKCLDAAQTGGSYTTKDRDGLVTLDVKFNSQPAKAIGTLSMDSLSSSLSTGLWSFRSLDGAGSVYQDISNGVPNYSVGSTGKFPIVDFTTTPPSGAYIDGTWDLQGWISFNVPQRTIDDAPEKKEVLTQFVTLAQDPAILNSVGALKYVAAAVPGSGFTTGQVLRAGYLNNNQCAPYNRNK